jgi:hypothetical protein
MTVISPLRERGAVAAKALNRKLQTALNPKRSNAPCIKGRFETCFYEGLVVVVVVFSDMV